MALGFTSNTFKRKAGSTKAGVEWKGPINVSMERNKELKKFFKLVMINAISSEVPSLPRLAVIMDGCAYVVDLSDVNDVPTPLHYPCAGSVSGSIGFTPTALVCVAASDSGSGAQTLVSINTAGAREPLKVADVIDSAAKLTTYSLSACLLLPTGSAAIAGDALVVIQPGYGLALLHTECQAACANHLNLYRQIILPFGLAYDSDPASKDKYVAAMTIGEGIEGLREVATTMDHENGARAATPRGHQGGSWWGLRQGAVWCT